MTNKITLNELTSALLKNQFQNETSDYKGSQTFSIVINYLSGKKRTSYKDIKKEILSQYDFNSYSKQLVNKAFQYKELKLSLKISFLPLSTINKIVSLVNSERLTLETINKSTKDLNNKSYTKLSDYKQAVDNMLNDIAPLEKSEDDILDNILENLSKLDNDHKQALLNALQLELKQA